MRVIKPHWCLHSDDKERPVSIFTLSLHPDGTRLATGGLDTKIKVWSTAPVLDEEKEMDEALPKLLSTLTAHSGVVMCIRWSNGGTYLASGSDDNIVMIWNLETGAGGKVWGSTDTNVENWKAQKRLVGHDSDVAGVAWSPDDSYLASVSLDSAVLVWSGATFELVRRLDGHMGFVKGVVFDPVGQFLASQSDDNTVKIWRTEDWGLHASIKEPFKNSPKTNLTRLSWSPDGVHIVTPNSMNGPVFVAAVIDRKSWTSGQSLVGHENIVEVTAFNPLLFLRDPSQPPTGANLCTLLALSARNGISIWITSQNQPVVVLDEVFDRDVLDMSWSADGTQLWSCSSEGHVCVFTFALSELGYPAPPSAKAACHATYKFNRRAPDVSRALVTYSSQQSQGGAPVGTLAQPNMLVSRKGPGAKRIVAPAARPVALPPVARQRSIFAVPESSQPPPPPRANAFASTSADPWAANNGAAAMDAARKRKADFGDDEEDAQVPSFGIVPRHSKAPYRTTGHTLASSAPRGPPLDPLKEIRPAYAPRDKEAMFLITNKENDDKAGGVRVLVVPGLTTYGTVKVEDGDEKDTLEWRNFGEGDRKGTSEVVVRTLSKTLWTDYLPSYVVLATGTPTFAAVGMEDGSLIAWSPTGRRLLPTLILDSPLSHLVSQGHFLLAITSLGTLHVWSLSPVPSALFPSSSLSPLLSSSATRIVPHPTITTAGLMPNGIPLIALSSGVTVIWDTLLGAWARIGESWWAKESDFWEGRRGRGGNVGGVVRRVESAVNDIVVDQGELTTSDEESSDQEDEEGEEEERKGGKRKKRKLEGGEKERVSTPATQRTASSLAHLEVRMKAAIALDSPTEYKGFLGAYAKRLAEEGLRSKGEELVKELLGPVYFKPGREEWKSTVLGFAKRDLLKDVLSTFAKSRILGGLGTEYQDILKKVAAS